MLAVASMVFDLPSRAEQMVAYRLRGKGVTFCADFQDAAPKDAQTMSAIACRNAPRVATPTGHGRRVLPGRRESSILPVAYSITGKRFDATFSLSVAPDSLSGRQELINAASAISGIMADIDDGRVVATMLDGTNRVELTAPWPAPAKAFATVTVTVSPDRMTLFLDGREAGSAALAKPVALLPRRWAIPGSVRYPFSGVVNDLVAWDRTLSAAEVRSLCGPRRDIRRQYAPVASRMVAAVRAFTVAVSSAFRVFDRLVPARGGPAVMRREYPILALHTSKADDRHFLRTHEKSLHNGYRTRRAAAIRQIGVFFGGRAFKAEAGLDDIYGGASACRRPAFIVKGDIPELFGASGVARLYPPEAHALVHPDAPDILPLNARYVRLYEDKAFKGLYAIEPFDAPGSAWMARGEPQKALYFNGRPKPSDLPPRGVGIAAARRAAASLALSDALFPWSAAELAVRRRRHQAARRQNGFSDFQNPVAPVEAIIGANPAPFFITEDLDLNAAGDDLDWFSSDLETISAAGAVRRPAGNRHRIVTMAATSRKTGAVQKYRLRVMAHERTLPSLFLSIGGLPAKEGRLDFTATLFPNDGSAATNMTGLAGNGGGLRHRGNTSYINGVKRSMSLKFDAPVDWPDPGHPARHVLMHCGYSDPTRLRNKICFDAFRAAFAGGPVPAPTFSFCELFVNGEWMGVWECSRRIPDLLPENTLLYKVRGISGALWKTTDTSLLDCVAHPESLDADPYAPIAELFGFTSGNVDAHGIANRFHIDNLLDYFLLLSFANNADGIYSNQYFARLPGDERFIVIPWDYDKTFIRQSRILRNRLFYLLKDAYPDFGQRLAGRWLGLRDGPMSDESVFGRIDADTERLAPYMGDEWDLLKPIGFDGTFDDAISALREAVRTQLDFMDGISRQLQSYGQ